MVGFVQDSWHEGRVDSCPSEHETAGLPERVKPSMQVTVYPSPDATVAASGFKEASPIIGLLQPEMC